MTKCNFCGKQEDQEYTFDDIFTCNDCINNTSNNMSHDDDTNHIIFIDSERKKYAITQEEELEITVENDVVSCLINEINFLKKQLEEKDFFIRQLFSTFKDTSLDKTPGCPKNISTPTLLNNENKYVSLSSLSSNTEKADNSSDTKFLSYNSNEINSTFIVKDEFRSSTANAENMKQQLKDVRLQKHKDYINSKSIYSNLTFESISDGEMIDSNNNVNKATTTILKEEHSNKISEFKRKIKAITEKINKPRYRVNNNVKLWPPKTTLIIGDSIIQGLEERRLKHYNAKIRSFPGARIDDLYDYLKPLLKKKPTNIILHIGTNDATDKTPGKLKNEINNLKTYIKENLPDVKLMFSLPTLRTDNPQAERTLKVVREYFSSENETVFISNDNIDKTCLGKQGLHLNPRGTGRLAINYISRMKCL